MKSIIKGGMLAGRRTYIISGVGILSAIGSYLIGDVNVFEMTAMIYPLAAIYFMRKGIEEKNNK